jgi:hypothetical protein
MKRRFAFVAAAIALGWPARALAQSDDVVELKQQGDELMRALHFREALEKYDAALKGGNPAVQYNRARVLQALGEYPLALDALEEFVRTATPELRARVPQLDDLIADLKTHVGMLAISSVPGATVTIDHKYAGTAPLAGPIRVSIGDALIEVSAPGYRPLSEHVRVVHGTMNIDATLERVFATGNVISAEPATRSTGVWRPLAFALGGTGIAILGAGAVFGGLAVAERGVLDQHCPAKACDTVGLAAQSDAWTYATLSTIGLIAGPVLAAGAVVLLLVSPHSSHHIALQPAIGPGWLSVSGTF